MLAALLNQGRYFGIYKTYKQAHEVVWRQYLPLIPKELIYRTNEQDLLIELHYAEGAKFILPGGEIVELNHDQSKPRSSIQLLGSDQADSHRGFKADGMIFDEYADQNPDNWKSVYAPMFTTTNGWAVFMGTPRGYNHFYDLNIKAQDRDNWFYQTATWRDSPYVSREHVDREREDAEKDGTLSTFLQEYELEFRSVQGAVYPTFNRDLHIIKPADVPEDLSYYGAIDFGWHTTAFLLVGIDKDQNWYVVDEVYGKERTLNDLIPEIKNKIGENRVVLIAADPANRDAIEVLIKEGLPVYGVKKNNQSISTGISLINNLLKPRLQLIGKPKPSIYFSKVCKNLTYEMEVYKYPEEKVDRNPSDIPMKENDHGPDALRYLVLHLKFGLVEDLPTPESDIKFNEFGLPI